MDERALPLLVFFTSPRSGPARRMESLVAHIAHRDRARLSVLYVDVDRRTDLVERLAVDDIPTVVLVVDKKVVARIDGRATAPMMEAMLSEHLAPLAV